MNLKFLHGDKTRITTDITPFNEGSFYVTHNGNMYVDRNTGTDSEPDNKNYFASSKAKALGKDEHLYPYKYQY